MDTDIEFNLDDPTFRKDPAPTFRELQSRCPVAHTHRPAPYWSVSRHADITEIVRDTGLWSSRFGPGLSYDDDASSVLVSSDPPAHTDERKTIAPAFRPNAFESMRSELEGVVDSLVNEWVEDGEGDLIELLAVPVPLTVICWLLGLPTDDIAMLRSWVMPLANAVGTPEGRSAGRAHEVHEQLRAYFLARIRDRRQLLAADPDAAPDDLMTTLIRTEKDGVGLSDETVLGFCRFLLTAGSATTTLLIGNLVHRLMEHPDQFDDVRRDRSLVEAAIEESLRRDAPVHGLFRTAQEATSLHGVDMPQDAKLLLLFAAANVDDSVWDDPERFDIHRDVRKLRRNYAFGWGRHYCLGAPLARMEAQIALGAVLDRLGDLRPTAPPTRIASGVLNGFEQLPVRWTPIG